MADSELAPKFAPFVGMVGPNASLHSVALSTDIAIQAGIAFAMVFGCTHTYPRPRPPVDERRRRYLLWYPG